MVMDPNVTLHDVVATLTKPEPYLRKALANMIACEREHGDLVLRIGRMGNGQVPHYRFDTRDVNPIFDYTIQVPVASFNGRSHQPLVAEGEEPEILRNEHWSATGVTRSELATLLGQVRQRGKR